MVDLSRIIAAVRRALTSRDHSAHDADDLVIEARIRFASYQPKKQMANNLQAFLPRTALNLFVDADRASSSRGKYVDVKDTVLVDLGPPDAPRGSPSELGGLHDVDRLPLCRSYSAVLLAALQVPVAGVDGVPAGPLLWAVGVPAQGQPEILGTWALSGLGATPAAVVVDERRARGLERIGLLIFDVADEVPAALSQAFAGPPVAADFHRSGRRVLAVAPAGTRAAVAAGLERIRRAPSAAHAQAMLDELAVSNWEGASKAVEECRAALGRWAAVYTLSQRGRRQLMQAEDAAWVLQGRMLCALERQGPMESAQAAAFAGGWLRQSEQRQRRQRLVLRHRAAAASWAA